MLILSPFPIQELTKTIFADPGYVLKFRVAVGGSTIDFKWKQKVKNKGYLQTAVDLIYGRVNLFLLI